MNKIINNGLTASLSDEYIEIINKRCINSLSSSIIPKKQEKITDYNLIIPTRENIEILYKYNYNKEQLKQFAKHYKLKISGNKKELTSRIFCYLNLSTYAIKIQKILRGNLARKYISYHGPALFKRSLCVNDCDFFTMDRLDSLSYLQFFSYRDEDGFIYGFDIMSINALLKQMSVDMTDHVKNPYNRNIISKQTLNNVKHILKLSKLFNITLQLEAENNPNEMSPKKILELRILSLFQIIDSLGSYSNPLWFSNLTRTHILTFLRELIDIWNYRAQITTETKRSICPPNGDPFRNFNLNYVYNEPNLDSVKLYVLQVLEKFVTTGINQDSKTLGSYYILGALTIVNENAAASLPWLYQSFSYFNNS